MSLFGCYQFACNNTIRERCKARVILAGKEHGCFGDGLFLCVLIASKAHKQQTNLQPHKANVNTLQAHPTTTCSSTYSTANREPHCTSHNQSFVKFTLPRDITTLLCAYPVPSKRDFLL